MQKLTLCGAVDYSSTVDRTLMIVVSYRVLHVALNWLSIFAVGLVAVCLILFVLQSAGYVVHLVHESTQVDPIHPLAQLSLAHPENHHLPAAGRAHSAVLLQHAWLHGQEDVGCLNDTAC